VALEAEAQRTRADDEKARADDEKARADDEKARADALAAELAALRADRARLEWMLAEALRLMPASIPNDLPTSRDEIDREILALLAQRAELGRRAGAEKERIGRAIRDRAREEALLQERRAWAQERSLDGDAVASVFDAIMHLSRRVQGA
jgi:chorismate mutase